MLRPLVVWLGSAVLLAVVACGKGGSDGATNPPPDLSDQEVLQAGWDAFASQDLAAATSQFRELLARGVLIPHAHDGLGWSFAYANAPDSARVHFQRAASAGADTAGIGDEVRAGLAVAFDALVEPVACLAATDTLTAGWVFLRDPALTRDDLIALRAVSYYALSQFAASLVEVQRLDPIFDCDVQTPSGRMQLAARIEALLS